MSSVAPELKTTDITEVVAALQQAMAGPVETSIRRRAEYSTDASNYRVVPQVVAFPRDADDLVAGLAVARSERLPVTMRGGGTSVAGNAIGPGIVFDTSRYCNQILEVDVAARTARVQPGVVLSDLQKLVAPHGLRFGPDPSTQNRATLGGMIGNNACGPHAVAFGRTADNVLALEVVDGLGRRFSAGGKTAENSDPLAVVPGLAELVQANLALIRTEFGRFSRQVSGYSLEHLLPEVGANLAKFLVGSEGTLATVLEATVKLVPVPKYRQTLAIGFSDMPSAADAVVPLLPLQLQAIEGLDARLVERVRGAKGDGAIPDLPAGAGWLFVEAGAESAAELADLVEQVRVVAAGNPMQVYDDAQTAARLWAIRADGAGLSGRTPTGAECWPGWEDAAVPPEKLGAYLRDFDELMAQHGLTGQPFGHFGDGCIHVRLDIPLQESGAPLRSFMTDAADLVRRYGGSLSGEHGDGRARSELLPTMYSDAAIKLFAEVKSLFDPHGNLNPGVLVEPAPLDLDLRRPQAPRVPAAGGFAFAHDHGDLTTALHRCTGVGKCRSSDIASGSGFMCPSYSATKDEKDVTRARARVLQEAITGKLVEGWNSRAVEESLDLCLSCKACSADCPSGVDMAAYKSEVLFRKYRRRLRPMAHYSIGWLPRWMRIINWMPALVNGVMAVSWIRKPLLTVMGLDRRRSLPKFAARPFHRSAMARQRRVTRDLMPAQRQNRVILWADSFTNGLDPQIPSAMIRVLEAAGVDVQVSAGDACCGVTWISTGQLDGARRQLAHLMSVLGPYAVNGIPIVGVEPSCLGVLRGDLVELFPDDPRAHAIARHTFTFAEVLTGRAPVALDPAWQLPSLADVDAVVQPHCHQYSVLGFTPDRDLLARAGARVTETAGCCGLAGNWGYEAGHYETSVQVAENSLLPTLAAAPSGSVYIADGVSCRTQAAQLAQVPGKHLAELLAERLSDSV